LTRRVRRGFVVFLGERDGWWVLIGLIPIIGVIWLLIELGFLKGTPEPNRFGPPVTE